MLELKKAALGIMAFGTMLLWACSGNGDRGVDSNDVSPYVHRPFVKHSFPLRQGRFSAVTCLAVDNQGHIFAAGFSDQNCVLIKLDAQLKTVIKMVRFGSTEGGSYFSQDTIKDMAIDRQGNIFVTGYTDHKSFPVTKGCYDNTMSAKSRYGNYEGFVTKFSPDLQLLASTFIGGEYRDKAHAIAIDRNGNIYVAGYSDGASKYQPSFIPPAGAYDSKPGPTQQSKAFVAKLSNDLSTLKAATLLGGNRKKYDSDDQAHDLAIDHEGNVWVTGQTRSDDFPITPGCIGRNLAGESDAFVSKFDADLKNLLASTYLGGAKNERANAIVIDAQGRAFVGGWSESADMLVFLEGYDTTHSRNEEDAFIVKLNGRLTHMEAGTFLGGEGSSREKGKKGVLHGDDKLSCMVLSDDGQTLYVAGRTESRDFDTTRPSRKAHYGNMVPNLTLDRCPYEGNFSTDTDYGDGFIARFDPQLTTRFSSTLFGGSSLDYIDDILIRGDNLYVSGETHSADFPKMPINYTINATRGFASCLSKHVCQKLPAQKPPVFKPRFSDAELKKIADSLLKDIKEHLLNNTMYPLLGKYAKARISRKDFEARMQRAFFIYKKPSSGTPLKLGIKFHHYNYYQNGKDGYDWIELCYVDRTFSKINWMVSTRHTTVYTNPNRGRIVLKIIAKNKKWEIADVDYRGFDPETGKRQMKKRLF